ncbi:DUF4013 domain-containing protein [Natrarchaeobaculum aegyptiacum]|uniref:DUF4013 domain-containing protein n=1 Tax=Natrarchaeobaculum aegyptiacum TaxID=745377 RepID=A0A2Z2HNG3_9EURY|nr:DUF4013 domain-containing protein [Natrarchaeobaculum aegyptiacum]ARS88476.1 hypothetical protein B1756_01050 [Natrarchaeobaculum aegyptiacum]
MWEALRYPIRGDYGEKAVIAAWLCVFVHAIALPLVALVPLLGYAGTLLARGSEPEPPSFLERSVLVRGLTASVLTIGYGIVPVGAALVAVQLFLGAGEPPDQDQALFLLAGSTTVLVLLAGYAYVLPIALANTVREGSLRAGFTDLIGVAGHAAYFVGWASGAVIFLLGVAIAGTLVDLGGIFTVVGSLVGAYATLASSRRIARGYAAVR